MDAILKIVSIALSCGMLYMAYIVRRVSGSWLLPSSIYCITWFLFTFIPLIVLPLVPSNPLAVGYILLTCICFSLPVLGVKWEKIPVVAGQEESKIFDRRFIRQIFYVFAAITFISLVISAVSQGLSLSSLTSNFFQASNSLIADRYNQSAVETIFSQISNVASYVAVSLGGLIFPGYTTKWGKVKIIAVAMTPSLIVMTVFGAKGMIFLCIAMFYAGTLVRRLRNGDYRLADAQTLAKSLGVVLLLLPFVTISFIARGLYEGGGQAGVFDGLFRYFISYSSAHLYAFSDWFSWYIGMHSDQIYALEAPTGGFYTFMSIFQALGSQKTVPPGVYEEYFQYSWYIQTNIYTIFRGLIVDYTLTGSLVVSIFLGFICNSIYVSMIKGRNASWSIAFYIAFAGFIYTSFIISLLIWNSMYPVFFIVAVVLMTNNEGAALEKRRQAEADRQSPAVGRSASFPAQT